MPPAKSQPYKKKAGIRVGIGGWTYEPWRGTFYPPGLKQADELEYASRQVSSIEINGTYYSSQKPESFRRWADETPDDFIFSVKASRFATNRRILSEAGPSIEKFFTGGVTELGSKLGPILWQFMPTKKFDAEDFGAFLALLPNTFRHAVEVRHESFVCTEFVALARKYKVAIVLADSAKYPTITETTGDFTYVRLQQAQADCPTGYKKTALKTWAARAKEAHKNKRDIFIYMINGAKERAPAAAQALLHQLKT